MPLRSPESVKYSGTLTELFVSYKGDTRTDFTSRNARAILKRTFDIGFSLFALIFVLSWLTPIVALLIRSDSKGPVFFGQVRGGQNGTSFICWKFRTMRPNVSQEFQQAYHGDPRITRIGAFLRKYNLDELPQFWNVIRGDMSIVGPRPHMQYHDQYYSERLPDYTKRYSVKPGVTGLAQATGNCGPTPTLAHMNRRVKFDLLYIKKASFGLDLYIILKTTYNSFFRSFHK